MTIFLAFNDHNGQNNLVVRDSNEVSTCYGYSPCNACKNCSACKHCSAGGTCGICAGKKETTPNSKSPTTKDTPPSNQCKAITKKGSRCSRSTKSNGFCWQHGG